VTRPSASERDERLRKLHRPSSELRLGSTLGEEAPMVDDSRHETFVIADKSLAGATAAAALREEGFSGRIVLVGEEHERPYERPPLSKDYLQGRSEREKIFVHPADWYAQHDAELQVGTRVTRVDAGAHELTVARRQAHTLRRALALLGSGHLCRG
jgi:3-phenylpropionate/trans-cinnamate dioxygenase ferredoxin reductase component